MLRSVTRAWASIDCWRAAEMHIEIPRGDDDAVRSASVMVAGWSAAAGAGDCGWPEKTTCGLGSGGGSVCWAKASEAQATVATKIQNFMNPGLFAVCVGLCAAGIRRWTPLPRRFKQDHRAGRRDVQRVHLSGHGDAQQMIAGAANQIVQPGAFASQHEHGIGPEIVAVVIRRAALVEADAPEVALLEHFKGANQIDHAREAKMLGGSGRGLDGDGAQRGGTALGEQDAVDAGGFGGAQQRAQVLRVFDAVESQDQARFGAIEQVFHPEKPALPDHGNHSLVGSGAGQRVRASRGSVRTGTPAARQSAMISVRRRASPWVRRSRATQTWSNLPGSGTQRLLDRVEAVNGFHPIKFILAEGANPTDNGEVTGNFGSGGVRFRGKAGNRRWLGRKNSKNWYPGESSAVVLASERVL